MSDAHYLRELRVRVASLRKQLWDASRTLDKLQASPLGKLGDVKRARKDVSAALHASYEVWRIVQDADPTLPPFFSPVTGPDALASDNSRGSDRLGD